MKKEENKLEYNGLLKLYAHVITIYPLAMFWTELILPGVTGPATPTASSLRLVH